jgi:hypothetical protein
LLICSYDFQNAFQERTCKIEHQAILWPTGMTSETL